MVLQVGLAKFYGKGLPRPWIYEDVKFNAQRVDPPTSPSAQLLSWAREANWTMGGMSSKRKRMQGKIEGSLKKLRDLQDDDDEEESEDVVVASGCKASNPSSVDNRPANEGLLTSDEDTDECSAETSLGDRIRAEKVIEAGLSSCRTLKGGHSNVGVNTVGEVSGGPDSVTRKASSARGSRGKKKHDSTGVEPVTSGCAASVRRSGRSSLVRRNRGQC